jgi:hypothetical protein
MLTYQIFTHTALSTVALSLRLPVPALSSLLNSNLTVAVFICAFAWMFLLSSIISNLMFGKQRRIFVQFLIGLILTLTASGILAGLKAVGVDLSNSHVILSNPYAQVFNNAYFSLFYLSLPFVSMIIMDLRAGLPHWRGALFA